jgi:hypothetical protein
MRRKRVIRLVSVAVALVSLANAASLFVLGATSMATLFMCLAIALALPKILGKWRGSTHKPLVALCVVGIVFFAPPTLNRITDGLHKIGDQAVVAGPESLSYPTRISLWWSALWLSLGGLAYGAPNAASEQFLMFFPSSGVRQKQSSFPTRSKKIRQHTKSARQSASNQAKVFHYDLVWPSYCQDNCDVGLSLNGGRLTVRVDSETGHCQAVAAVGVRYDPKYRSSTILGLDIWSHRYRLRIDQAAFWALQELDWLHPYTMSYRWRCDD